MSVCGTFESLNLEPGSGVGGRGVGGGGNALPATFILRVLSAFCMLFKLVMAM